MTPTRFLECLDALGWSQRHLSQLLACDTNLPTRWGRGDAAIPPEIATWLERRVRAAERWPVPQDWRRR